MGWRRLEVEVHRVRYAALVLLVLACGSGPGEPVVVERMDGLQGFEAALDSLRVGLRVPAFGVAIVEDEQVVWSRGLGHADLESGTLATGTTSFHLASLTKTFASTIIMQLVEQGLVDLDDPISDYGIDLPSSGVIRIRHLMNHTSGDVPGSSYRYDGSRFAELDKVIEHATGRSFAELLNEQILRPLDLHHTAPNVRQPTAFAVTGLDLTGFKANMAKPYEFESGEVVASEYPSYFGVSAGLIASARDMARYSIAIDQGEFLQPATWDSVFTPAVSNDGETLPYGLGWFIYWHQGVKVEWHYGWWNGNSSLIVRVPQRRLAFVVLANTSRLSAAYGLGGDANVLRSDVAKLFIDSFVFGNEPLPEGHQ